MRLSKKLKQAHLSTIKKTSQDLLSFASRTKDPAPLPHQFVGAVADNTAGLLTAPANSLDEGCRIVTFSDDRNWISLMGTVHRSFYSSFHLAVEKGLRIICEEKELEPKSAITQQGAAVVGTIREFTSGIESGTDVKKAMRWLERYFTRSILHFDDYLNAVLKASSLTKKRQKQWRNFFIALSVVRNKVSHSDTTLAEADKKKLKAGGCEVFISPKGELHSNTTHYSQILKHGLDFLDEVMK